MLKYLSIPVVVLISAHSVEAATTNITDLYNTGLDDSGNLLGNSIIEPHYQFVFAPAGSNFNTTVVLDDDFPVGNPWVPNDGNSQWIGPNSHDASSPPGNFLYRTQFTLPDNVDLSTVKITGLWSADDSGEILINGNSTGQFALNLTTKHSFTIADGFQVGTNNLDFNVFNAIPSPTGLLVDDIVGTFETVSTEPVPEPITMLSSFMALGFGALLTKFDSKQKS